MKLTGYTRKSDGLLKKEMGLFVRDRGKLPTIFTFGDPLCPIDKRRCSQKGKIQEGSCSDTYSWFSWAWKAGPCRKVELEYCVSITIKAL